MEDKTKWFGRYLGCEITFSNEHGKIMTLTGVDYHMDTLYSNRWMDEEFSPFNALLILKELKDISEKDFIGLLDALGIEYTSIKGMYSTSKSITLVFYLDPDVDYTDGNDEYILYLNSNMTYIEADYLRSKGYAVGIPKEYYITESELKDETNG